MIDQDSRTGRRYNSTALHGMGFAALVAVTLIIYAWRAPELLTRPQFWAEDGAVFFAQQYDKLWPQLFTPYWGYIHFIPRSIAWIASLFDVKYAPFLYGIFGLIADALCVAYVTRRSEKYFAPAVVWLSFTLLPNDGLYYGYIANIQWFSQFVVIAMCLYPVDNDRPHSVARNLLTYASLGVCALTGPFSVIVAALVGAVLLVGQLGRFKLPFAAVWRAAARYGKIIPRDRLLLVAACALIQLGTTLRNSVGSRLDMPSPGFILDVFGSWSQVHFFGSVFFPAGLFLLVLLFGTFLLLLCDKVSGIQKFTCLIMLAMAICELLLGAIKPGAISQGMMGGDRYYFLGKTAAWWVIALIAGQYVTRSTQRLLMIVALMIWISMLNINWMRRAPLPDLNWRQQAGQIDAGIPTPLHINPSWWDNKVIILSPPTPRRSK